MTTIQQTHIKSTMQNKTSVELIKLAREGNESAFEEIYNRYAANVFCLANDHLNEKFRRRLNPEDLVQSIFRTIWRTTRNQDRKLEDFTSDEGLRTWLVTIALNKIFSKIKHNQRKMRDVGAERNLSPEARDAVLSNASFRTPIPESIVEAADLYERIIRNLDPTNQQILQFLVSGYNQKETAELVNVTPRTVRRRVKEIKTTVEQLVDADGAN